MNTVNDKLPTPKGKVNIKCYIDGKLDWEETTENLVVSNGRYMICNSLSGNTGYDIQKVGVGTNATTPAITDIALTGSFLKNLNQGLITYPTPTSMIIPFTIDATEANGITIQEFGLADQNDNLFSRMTRGAIVKTSAMSLVCTWTLTF